MAESGNALWSVDRSWGNVAANADGDPYLSSYTKYHLDRGDSTARCSKRILLNSLIGQRPAGTIQECERDMPQWVCRRCVPRERA